MEEHINLLKKTLAGLTDYVSRARNNNACLACGVMFGRPHRANCMVGKAVEINQSIPEQVVPEPEKQPTPLVK
jgi:hypothetical protein